MKTYSIIIDCDVLSRKEIFYGLVPNIFELIGAPELADKMTKYTVDTNRAKSPAMKITIVSESAIYIFSLNNEDEIFMIMKYPEFDKIAILEHEEQSNDCPNYIGVFRDSINK